MRGQVATNFSSRYDLRVTDKPSPRRPLLLRLALWLIALGSLAALSSAAGLFWLHTIPVPAVEDGGVAHAFDSSFPTPTPPRQAVIGRNPVMTTPATTLTSMPTASPILPPEIEWSDAEKNALSWLCYYEIRGMQEAKIDACLSVISTVRARYAYRSGFSESDVIATILRPGQFTGVEIDTNRPAPDSEIVWAVGQYQAGLRGSCNGFLYFDSIAGGPVLCVILASNGQFLEFHNGWN